MLCSPVKSGPQLARHKSVCHAVTAVQQCQGLYRPTSFADVVGEYFEFEAPLRWALIMPVVGLVWGPGMGVTLEDYHQGWGYVETGRTVG